MRNLFFSGLLLLCTLYSFSQSKNKAQEPLKWISFAEAKEAFGKEQRPILINFFDSKNDSCQMMIDSVYSDPVVISYLNQSFYAVNFDVNTQDEVTFFDGQVYKPQEKGSHGLVQKLIPNVKLPGVLFFNREANGTAYNNYIDKHRMLGFLLYYSEDAYKSTDWTDFYDEYTSTFPKEKGRGFTIVRTVVEWLSMEEALTKQEKNPKPIFLDIYANWKNTSTIMLVSTYADDTIASILNKEFYPVRFEATTRDTMILKGTTFTNPAKTKEDVKLHEFASTLLLSNKKPFRFPTLVFFDEKIGKPITFYQEFWGKKSLEALLRYYSSGAYKTEVFEKYKTRYKVSAKKTPEK